MSALNAVRLTPGYSGKYTASARKPRLRHFFSLLQALVYGDVMTRYRKSILGPAWAIVQPLVYMVVFTFLRGVTGVSDEGIAYPIFTFSAPVPWTFLSNAIVTSAPSVMLNASVVKKIAVPREIFPLSAVMKALFNFAMAGLVLAGLVIYYRISVGWTFLWLPVLLALTAMLAFVG